MYIADHHGERIQMWPQGATSGTTRASKSVGTSVGHPEYITMDKNGNLYVTGHTQETVLCFASNSYTSTSSTSSTSTSSTSTTTSTSTSTSTTSSTSIFLI